MPVTIYPSAHGSKVIPHSAGPASIDAAKLLESACGAGSKDCLELIQSSFDDLSSAVTGNSNGFVNCAIRAYSQHHHLVIRPDDVWAAILTQFSFYVNKHAEDLRHMFVTHEGQKELRMVYGACNRYNFDFGIFAQDISRLIEENVIDPDLRDWIMPAFTTTTRHDTVIASIIMMGTMQKYFTYYCMLTCGLPSVTLLGQKSDYELIAHRLDKLCTFGDEPSEFYRLLKPVVDRFILSFEQPESSQTNEFWQHICKEHRNGSGTDHLSGWITSFCFWDSEGRRLARSYSLPEIGDSHVQGVFSVGDDEFDQTLVIDGIPYPKIYQYAIGSNKGIPVGYCTVPVTVNDNGYEFKAKMVAGSVGIQYTSSGTETVDGTIGLDTMQARAGWWIYQKRE